MIKSARLAVASWSTFGQTALLIIAALILAQVLAFFLARNVIDEWQRAAVEGPAVGRFVEVLGQIEAAPASQQAQIMAVANRQGEQFWLMSDTNFGLFPRHPGLETALNDALAKRGVKAMAVVAFRSGEGVPAFGFRTLARPDFAHTPPANTAPNLTDIPRLDPAQPLRNGRDFAPQSLSPGTAPLVFAPQGGMHPLGFGDGHRLGAILRFGALMPNGQWLMGRFEVMQPFPRLMNPVFLFQVALFVILLAGTLFWAARISQPLRLLARAAEQLQPQAQIEPLPVKGPRDVQLAIQSFNTMAMRVRELLHEKDRMLTAIGHDLRTPLASLRIRAESIEPEGEREKIVETINEMTAMVDEILALARLGHSTEARQRVDLSALADAVVEEFSGIGAAVVFLDSPRAPVLMQAGLVRRLLRNLIDNAIKYGERARVSVLLRDDAVDLIVDDDGPGIPAEQLQEVLQPFTRLEHSRSRTTGGSGLGLSIADAIARSQGAALTLENRSTGGLRAIVSWPSISA